MDRSSSAIGSQYSGDWIRVEPTIENGKIIAQVPKVENFDPEVLTYSVDVALNGQQFTGKPVMFRYYDIQITRVTPNVGPSEGGTKILITGRGLYDAGTKKIKFTTKDGKGKREVQAEWDKVNKALSVIVPPYSWLFGEDAQQQDEEEEKKEDEEGVQEGSKLVSAQINFSLTLNN